MSTATIEEQLARLSPQAQKLMRHKIKNRKAAAAASAEEPAAQSLSSANPNRDRWIEIPKPNPDAKLRLFTFHYAGGAKSVYQTWWHDFPEQIEILTVQLPGREDRMREPPYRDFYPLSQALGTAVAPYLDRPFAFFGHCMGALTSFELVRQMRRQGMPLPLHLFVSAYIGPHIRHSESLVARMGSTDIKSFFKILDGTPKEILENLGMMRMNQPLAQADIDLVNAYQYIEEKPLDIPITAFAGANDKLVLVKEIEEWQRQTTKDFRLHFLPGDHFFLNGHRKHLMQAMTDKVKHVLHEAADDSPAGE